MRVLRKSIRVIWFIAAAALMVPLNTDAQTFNGLGFTGPESDGRPGEYYFYKGVEAVRKKDYEFALQMYQVAASWAYKTAEYNLSVMYMHGEGVPVDRSRAMAWIALAAERDDPKFVDARERLYAELTPEEFAKANEIWRELKPNYGDQSALRRAKAKWVETKHDTTGSHVGFVGNVAVGADSPGPTAFMVKQLSAGVHGPNDTDPTKLTGPHSAQGADGFANAAFGLTGGNQIDGTIAYKQFQISDNPYDPIFEHGIVTVGAVESAAKAKQPAVDRPPTKPVDPQQ
jgi:Sel1 repeat